MNPHFGDILLFACFVDYQCKKSKAAFNNPETGITTKNTDSR